MIALQTAAPEFYSDLGDVLRLFYGEGLKMAIRNCSPAGVCIEIQFKEEGKKDTYVPAADRG